MNWYRLCYYVFAITAWIVKTSVLHSQPFFDKTIYPAMGEGADIVITDAARTQEGGMVIAGYNQASGGKSFLMNMAADGTFRWGKEFGQEHTSYGLWHVSVDSIGTILLFGNEHIVAFSSDGVLQWLNKYRINRGATITFLQPISNRRYIIGGYAEVLEYSGKLDYFGPFVVLLDSIGKAHSGCDGLGGNDGQWIYNYYSSAIELADHSILSLCQRYDSLQPS